MNNISTSRGNISRSKSPSAASSRPATTTPSNTGSFSRPNPTDRVEFSHELAGYDVDMQRCGTNFRCAQRLQELYG